MRYVVLDFETFFSKEYTLSKLSTEAYIRDKRFEPHGAAIKWAPDIPARWYDARQLAYILKTEDWSDVFLIAHRAQFDGFIIAHHYGISPKMWGCTLSMARLAIGAHVSASLDSVRSHFGIPAKRTPYDLFKGKHWHELTADVQQQVAEGACDEVESIWQIFCKLSKTFPPEEYFVVDEVIRMFTEPVLRLDKVLLQELWTREEQNKKQLIKELGLQNPDALQSAPRFQKLLEAEGIEIEFKKGGIRKDGTREDIPAFGKSDPFMVGLSEHPNPRIRALVEARLACKSTLLQTRAETLLWTADRGALPVYLNYAGAGTLRPSGGDKCNWLNFKRGSDIRKAILAPEGYLLCPVDSSQIEFRVGLYLAAQKDVLNNIAQGGDPYSEIASKFYREKIYKPKQNDPRAAEMEAKRGCGKQAMLMCQYGAGWKKFQATAKAGLYGPSVVLTDKQAIDFVDLYRYTCSQVVRYWRDADEVIPELANGAELEWGPLVVRKKRIYLPNGCPLIYDTLHWHKAENINQRDGWCVKTRQGLKAMFGARLLQNICEAVSRVIVTQAMLRIKSMGIRTLNHPYDELLLLIPNSTSGDKAAQNTVAKCLHEMKVTPDWLPGLPLDAESHLSERYAK